MSIDNQTNEQASVRLLEIKVEKIKEDWFNFISTGNAEKISNVRPEIVESWKRSYSMNVSPFTVPTDKPGYRLSYQELQKRLEEKKHLLDIVSPLLNLLLENLGPMFRIDFYDQELYLIKQYFYSNESLKINNFTVLGVNRSEAYTGTNAAALAHISKKPIQLTGPEHYLKLVHSATCSAAPLFTHDNIYQGVINIYGPSEKVQEHTLAMVVTLTKTIEQSFLQYQYLREKEVGLKYIENIVDSISEGIIALDSDGIITIFNKTAGSVLSIDPEAVIGKNASYFFGENSSIIQTLKNKYSILDKELLINFDNKDINVFGSSFPVTHPNLSTGGMMVFKKSATANKMIKNIAGFNAHYTFDDLHGQNDAFLNTIVLAKQAARFPSNVLLIGESGTGKELLAQSIHNASNMADGPFVGINCACIPAGLVESELFGYESGTFTGGRKDGKPGKLALAEGGTLFLDEINSLSLTHQAALLRVLQNRTYFRVGGTSEQTFNARLIVASNKNLSEEIKAGTFRADLYYRVNVITINIPPLRERLDDIHDLANYFVNQSSKNLNHTFSISNEVIEEFKKFNWAGNIRALENLIERAAVTALSKNKRHIDMEIISLCFSNQSNRNGTTQYDDNAYLNNRDSIAVKSSSDNTLVLSRDNDECTFAHFEKQIIEQILSEMAYNVTLTAKKLGISRRTIYNKIERYNIEMSENQPLPLQN